jgi:virulence-associated protein VapD
MFAIGFDLVVAETAANHPKGVSRPIPTSATRWPGSGSSGCRAACPNDDMANLFSAIMALKALPWFPASVRDIRAFKVKHWSDFTGIIKGT